MDLCLRTLAALFVLVATATCTPLRRRRTLDAWAGARDSALELNSVAGTVSVEVRNGSKNMDEVSIEPAWIEAGDMCDPETIRIAKKSCLQKIFSVSRGYSAALHTISTFESCAGQVQKVVPLVDYLQKNLTACADLDAETPVIKIEEPVPEWEKRSLCLYTLERLYSFSILTARVLAVGDPSYHEAFEAPRCRRG